MSKNKVYITVNFQLKQGVSWSKNLRNKNIQVEKRKIHLQIN